LVSSTEPRLEFYEHIASWIRELIQKRGAITVEEAHDITGYSKWTIHHIFMEMAEREGYVYENGTLIDPRNKR